MSGQVETYKRQHDYLLPYPAVVSRVSTLLIPEGYDVTYLPESFDHNSTGDVVLFFHPGG